VSVRGRHAELWTRAALNPPRAHGAPLEADAGTITLSFMLARGQFATSVLREICELESTPALESDDE